MFLALDYFAGQIGAGLLVRLGLQAPALVIGIVLLDRQRPPAVAAAAILAPIIVLLVTSVLLGVMSSQDKSELYLVSAGVTSLSLNLAFRLRLRHALALCLGVLPIYIGLPMSGLFGDQTSQTICTIWIMSLLTMASLISVARRERSEQEIYLLNLRNDEQSHELQRLVAELSRQSIIDALTQIGNRRFFDETFHRLWTEAARADSRLALAMVDIDHFKSLNDVAGHREGDRCLCAVANAIATGSEAVQGIAARFGGEEFAVLVPLPAVSSRDNSEAMTLGERVRTAVEDLGICHPGRPSGDILTVSVGVAIVSPASNRETPAALIETADQALYRSKRAGRNRVTVARAAPTGHACGSAAA